MRLINDPFSKIGVRLVNSLFSSSMKSLIGKKGIHQSDPDFLYDPFSNPAGPVETRRHVLRFLQKGQHIPNRPIQADQSRASDDVVADVQLDNLRDFSDRTDIAIGQAVAGQDAHGARVGELGRLPNRVESLRSLLGWPIRECPVRVARSVQLNCACPQTQRGADLLFGRIDKQTDGDVDGLKPLDGIRDCRLVVRAVKSPGRCDLAGKFGNERNLVRYDVQRNTNHLVGGSHLHIQLCLYRFTQDFDVAMLDMPAIAAKMDSYAVRAGQFTDGGGGRRIGLIGAAGLPGRGNMIDVYSQERRGGLPLSALPPMRARSKNNLRP